MDKVWGEAYTSSDDNELIERLKDEAYEVPIERAIKIKVTAWDVNCPQHIKQRFTLEEMGNIIK